MQWSQTLWSVFYSAPSFLVFALAVVLGLINLKKHKPAAGYLALGGGIGSLVKVSLVAVQEVIWAKMSNYGSEIQTMNTLLSVINIGGKVVEAVGMAMIVFAVFAGRKAVRRDDDEPTARPSRPRS